MTAKPIMVIRAPVTTRSGYGDMSRDIVRHLINLDKWEIHVVSCMWGQTPTNALNETNHKDKMILDHILKNQKLPRQPEIFISITVPNEFQPAGRYNIGITAGIETTACSPEWIQGMNRMDLILTISEHSKKVLESTIYNAKDQNTGAMLPPLKLVKPIEILHNCIDTGIFHKTRPTELEPLVEDLMVSVKEKFCFLFVGHWLSGNLGADRKDVGMLVKVFLEVFRRTPKDKRPALILKSSGAGFSVLDREQILQKLEAVKNSMPSKNLPNVYLLHGELTESEMNSLYNHPKIKAHVSFTKGEGFGRPLLEACMSEKPIIVSGWSGQLDFLNVDEAILLGGKLVVVDASAVWQGVINEGTQWFQVDYNNAANVLMHVWKNYDTVRNRGIKLARKNAEAFNFAAIQQRTDALMTKYLPPFKVPEQLNLVLPSLPSLRKITTKTELPKLQKLTIKKEQEERVAEKHDMLIPIGVEAQAQKGVEASKPESQPADEAIAREGEEVNG
jgi:hypothetical protein